LLICYRNTAKAAYGAVDIPEGVIDLLTGLRDYLQVIALTTSWSVPTVHRD
jgi:hypothetical protein